MMPLDECILCSGAFRTRSHLRISKYQSLTLFGRVVLLWFLAYKENMPCHAHCTAPAHVSLRRHIRPSAGKTHAETVKLAPKSPADMLSALLSWTETAAPGKNGTFWAVILKTGVPLSNLLSRV